VGVTPGARVHGRLNLPALEATLRRSQRRGLDESDGRDPLDDRVLGNLLAGYAYVDALIDARVDAFAMGSLKHLLELNTLVLCGASPERRAAHAGHLQATERRFYGDGAEGVRDVVEWVAAHRDASPWERAGGVYVTMLSRPQLFIEGNHRTGGLIMAYVLARDAQPPFVLSPENAVLYFEISASIRDIPKSSPAMRFRLSAATSAVASFLAAHADSRYLVAT